MLKVAQSNGLDNNFDPTRTAKYTRDFFATPGVKMEGYSTKTMHEGKSSTELVVDGRTLKLESVNVKTYLGNISFGSNGSLSYGNSILSVGSDPNGIITIDMSLPTGKSSSLGTTLYYNPQNFINNLIYIKESVLDGLANPAFNPAKYIPLPFPGPVPVLTP